MHIGVTHPGGSIKGNESSIEISSGSGTMLVNLFIKTDLEDYSVLVVNHRIKQNLIVTDCFDLGIV